ncbi:hypothetical protein APHAL10511_003322 [Amanita phalloides]|nr:hypothetical protein APHAL10511_003322 [Amanita phalloides]
MPPHILKLNPLPEDSEWRFNVPASALSPPRNPKPGVIYGRGISFTAEKITIQIDQFSSNRILRSDDPSKFVRVSFGGLRFPDSSIQVTAKYISQFMKSGLFLNGIQYRFYHHSNSQLRERSCFLRQANNDAELDDRIYKLGDFGKIMIVAKRAKRIGLLFSAAELDYNLDPKHIGDIPDIKSGDEIFSDGCGLISRRLARELSKVMHIIYRGQRYTPTVFQIRYLGYKGVLMLHPQLDAEKKYWAQFRASMKKFTTNVDHRFSVVNYSRPYVFGRLNNDVIVLLSSLGVSNDAIQAKQQEYFKWIEGASQDPVKAIDMLYCVGQYELADKTLLKGLDDPTVYQQVMKAQASEIAGFKKGGDKFKSRMIIHNSRRLYGVCDPYRVLREGEVHIRITVSRKGETTPINADVLVVRNPCLHPGDCLKLRAVQNDELSHLVDCVVFASVGRRAAPAMSSGGDLDGDEYFVCWDKDIVQPYRVQSYDYPPNKEHSNAKVTREDLANYFASYNNVGVARVAALHAKWVRSAEKGALSPECQELNALHSKAVDGGKVKIPERLAKPPDPKEDFILTLLEKDAKEFQDKHAASADGRALLRYANPEDGKELLTRLLQSEQNALSEYELFELAYRHARKLSLDAKSNVDITPFMNYVDFSALTLAQKYAMSNTLGVSADEHPEIWNSLVRSDILTPRDLYQRSLGKPFPIQRLYSSKKNGLKTFFEYLKIATQQYTRKLLLIQLEGRFAFGVFMRGPIAWDEDPEVNDKVVVCSFMPQTSSTQATLRPCTTGYRLHFSDIDLQLYNKNRQDTFIFLTSTWPGADIAASIALQKISKIVQQQVGRVLRSEVKAIELHVVSNRDRVAHQLFDLWFEHVPTEEYIRRFDRKPQPYRYNDIREVDWSKHEDWLKGAFIPDAYIDGIRETKHTERTIRVYLSTRTQEEIKRIVNFAFEYHAENEIYLIFNEIISQRPLDRHQEIITELLDRLPELTFVMLKAYPPDDVTQASNDHVEFLAVTILRCIIRSANKVGIASLVALEKLAGTIATINLEAYLELLMLVALSVRAPQLVQEVLLVLNDSRHRTGDVMTAMKYGYKHALGIAFERAEEAGDECPCDEDGNIKKNKRNPPSQCKLHFMEGSKNRVKADVRVDARSPVRLHSHVRLKAASHAENRWLGTLVLDGVVYQANIGEYRIELFHHPPPETEKIDWNMYNAGSIANSRSMIDALRRLLTEKEASCAFYGIITGDNDTSEQDADENPIEQLEEGFVPSDNLNDSQIAAVNSCTSPLSLIWGPPGTGKTTVVIQILRRFLATATHSKILMTASTHNAVDNVLERFIKINREERLLPNEEEQLLRVATDQSKVNKALRNYTIDARVGGDLNENNKLLKKAKQRVENAVIIFTTCAGAGLGILRAVDFDIAIIDEASQVTEPGALVPLVKGIKKAILVGDHVQLRPTVRNMGKTLQFDMSLLERLYSQSDETTGMRKTMLNVQYRFSQELNAFPSREFYQGRLMTGNTDSATILQPLALTAFPWPRHDDLLVPTVFIQCSAEEDMGGRSKSNIGQVEVVQQMIPLLTSKGDGEASGLSVTVLTPYTKQIKELRSRLPSAIECSTVDAFQGRESDVIVFSTVRCNDEGEIGFLDDPRRLNVMWTRAKLALVIVGDRKTMSTNELWKRAIEACSEVQILVPTQ